MSAQSSLVGRSGQVFIRDIVEGRCSRRFVCRISRMWRPINYQRGGEIMSLDFVAVDEEEDSILCTVRSRFIPQFEGLLDDGGVIAIKNFSAFVCKPFYRVVHGRNFYIVLDAPASVEKIVRDVPVILRYKFDVVEFNQLETVSDSRRYLCDIVGHAASISDIGERVVKGVTKSLQNVDLKNYSGETLKLAVWGNDMISDVAKLIRANSRNWLITSTVVTVDPIGGVRVGTSGATQFFDSEDIDELMEFRARLSTDIRGSELIKTVMYSPYVRQSEYDSKKRTIAQVIEILNESGSFDPSLFVSATIDKILDQNGWRYNSCAKCLKKLLLIDQQFYCEKCGKYENSAVVRYRVEVVLADGTGTINAVMFDKDVDRIVVIKAGQLAQKLAETGCDDPIPKALRVLLGKSFIFQLKFNEHNRNTGYENFTVTRVLGDNDIKPDVDEKINDDSCKQGVGELGVPTPSLSEKRRFTVLEDGESVRGQPIRRRLALNDDDEGDGESNHNTEAQEVEITAGLSKPRLKQKGKKK